MKIIPPKTPIFSPHINVIRPTVDLTRPLIAPAFIREKITCIRGHRERIFRVDSEIQGKKLIVHNYGQGGAGFTFLFGCVNESLRLFEAHKTLNPSLKNKPIAVVGAGCYGLLTAALLTQQGHSVRIVAHQTENLTSHKAAGFFFPRARKTSTPEEYATFTQLGIESYKTYLAIAAGDHPFITKGAYLVPAYYSPTIDPGFGAYIAQGLISKPNDVAISFGTNRHEATQYTTIFMHTTQLMHELQNTVDSYQIPIINHTINSFDALQESIIFNCTGLGAQDLTTDKRLVPVLGHLISLYNQPNPEQLDYLLNVKVLSTSPRGTPRDELIYFAPKDQGILGVTFLRGQTRPEQHEHEFDRILERANKFFGFK